MVSGGLLWWPTPPGQHASSLWGPPRFPPSCSPPPLHQPPGPCLCGESQPRVPSPAFLPCVLHLMSFRLLRGRCSLILLCGPQQHQACGLDRVPTQGVAAVRTWPSLYGGSLLFFWFLPPPPPPKHNLDWNFAFRIYKLSHSDQHLASFPKALLRHKVSFLRNMSHCGQLGLSQPGHTFSGGLAWGQLPPKAFPIPKDISKPAPLGSSLFLFYLTFRSPFLAIPTKKGKTHSVPDLKQWFVPACRLRPRWSEFFLAFLGLQDTLALWKCVLTLLQSEEQVIRDAATETVMTAMSQENTRRSTGTSFLPLFDASELLDRSWRIFCEGPETESFRPFSLCLNSAILVGKRPKQ